MFLEVLGCLMLEAYQKNFFGGVVESFEHIGAKLLTHVEIFDVQVVLSQQDLYLK
jgi:hypothetical protein